MTIATDIGNIQSGLNNLWATTSNSASTASSTLNRQNDMRNIIDQENQRLAAKQQQISGAVVNTQRAIALNESSRKRQVQFIYILLLLILGLLIYLFLRNIELFFPFIPSFITDFLTILAMGIIFIYIVILLRDISMRSNTNFDELNLPPPVVNQAANAAAQQNSALTTGDLLSAISYGNSCIGESCCAPGVSKWNMGTMKCVATCSADSSTGYPRYDLSGQCYPQYIKDGNGNQQLNNATVIVGGSNVTLGIDYVLCGSAWIPKGQQCFVSENFEPMVNGPQPNTASEINLYSPV
jgi:hypothetical protein